MTRVRSTAEALLIATVLMALAACAPSGAGSRDRAGAALSLVGFAVTKAGNSAAQSAFAATPEGRGTTWTQSYGASGDQSRAVAGGLDADYVHVSVTPDMTRLVEAGLVDGSWADGPHRGIVTTSVVVLVVREGNPHNIRGWDDLVRDDIAVVTANPGSSGAARWNLLAAWQHAIAQGGSERDAATFVHRLLDNVKALPGSGRDATQTFRSGTGDVLISYENEAILARQHGEPIDYIVPPDTLLIENPAAVLKDADPAAQAFLDFVLTPEGQAAYIAKGFRPLRTIDGVDVREVEGAMNPADPFPAIEALFTIDDLGGWEAVNARFFDENDGIITRLQAAAGLGS